MNNNEDYPDDPSASQKDIDTLYDDIDNMLKRGEWKHLDGIFQSFLTKVNEMPLDIILAYVIASLPAGSKIMYRREFIDLCKKRFPGESLWQGL